MSDRKLKSIVGCLLGTAVGSALGLPYKGLSRNKIYKFATPIRGHNLFFRKGALSDDAEQICMVAQSLIVSRGEVNRFTECLALRLRYWLLGIPAKIGSATLNSILRLWLQFTPSDSGVNSAENDALNRSIILGVCYGEDKLKLLTLIKAATTISHKNSQAELGAIAIAVAAYLASCKTSVSPSDYYQTLREYLEVEANKFFSLIEITAFLSIIEQACESAANKESGVMFADRLGNHRGIRDYVYDAVLMVIQIWLRQQHNYSDGVREIIYLGGDTDTTAAILGGIIGAGVGKPGIPKKWLDNLWDFPRTVRWIENLGERLARTCLEDIKQPPLPLAFYLIPLRNILFLAIVLFHGFYRLLPPY